MKKGVLKNFTKFTGKKMYQSLFFNKVFIKKETLAQVFPVNFAKLLRTPFLKNTSGRLLLRELIDHAFRYFSKTFGLKGISIFTNRVGKNIFT